MLGGVGWYLGWEGGSWVESCLRAQLKTRFQTNELHNIKHNVLILMIHGINCFYSNIIKSEHQYYVELKVFVLSH